MHSSSCAGGKEPYLICVTSTLRLAAMGTRPFPGWHAVKVAVSLNKEQNLLACVVMIFYCVQNSIYCPGLGESVVLEVVRRYLLKSHHTKSSHSYKTRKGKVPTRG